jgi:hypothetical protein
VKDKNGVERIIHESLVPGKSDPLWFWLVQVRILGWAGVSLSGGVEGVVYIIGIVASPAILFLTTRATWRLISAWLAQVIAVPAISALSYLHTPSARGALVKLHMQVSGREYSVDPRIRGALSFAQRAISVDQGDLIEALRDPTSRLFGMYLVSCADSEGIAHELLQVARDNRDLIGSAALVALANLRLADRSERDDIIEGIRKIMLDQERPFDNRLSAYQTLRKLGQKPRLPIPTLLDADKALRRIASVLRAHATWKLVAQAGCTLLIFPVVAFVAFLVAVLLFLAAGLKYVSIWLLLPFIVLFSAYSAVWLVRKLPWFSR